MQSFEQFWEHVCTYDLKSDYKFHELKANFKESNGCGSKGGMKFPSSFFFVKIVAACSIHDIEWFFAKSYEDLIKSNERFDNNLKRITDYESNKVTRWIRRQFISYYVSGVELVGTRKYAEARQFSDIPEFNHRKTMREKFFDIWGKK